MMPLFDRILDRFFETKAFGWMEEHMPPKWLAPTLSIISIIVSISAMVLATRAR